MTSDAVRPGACDRAREDASARLDGELSELDDARLRSHLLRCDECRAFADSLAEIAGAVRAMPLEAIRGVVRRPRSRTLLGARIAAAAVGAAAAAAAAMWSLPADGSHARAVVSVSSAIRQLDADRVPPGLRGADDSAVGVFVAT